MKIGICSPVASIQRNRNRFSTIIPNENNHKIAFEMGKKSQITDWLCQGSIVGLAHLVSTLLNIADAKKKTFNLDALVESAGSFHFRIYRDSMLAVLYRRGESNVLRAAKIESDQPINSNKLSRSHRSSTRKKTAMCKSLSKVSIN